MTTILITDGFERAALASCRSLVGAGYDVHVAAAARPSLAGVSNKARGHLVGADPVAHPAEFAAAIGALAGRIGARLLLPISDPSVSAVLAHPGCVPEGCVVPFPPHEAFRRASDKVGLLPLARAAGFGIPESTVITTRGDGKHADLESLLPGVIKPHRSVVQIGPAQSRLGVQRFETVADGRRLLVELPEEAFPVVAQRRIEGSGVGFFALRWDGRVRAAFAHRRLREIPPSGGVSVYRESIALDSDLATAGTRLLEALAWQGVAMIECKREATTGRHYVIEINPRLWGSLQLAIDAGVDFPRLLVECALGQPSEPPASYRVGIRSRWLWGEMDHIYLRVKLREPGESAVRTLLGALVQVARHRPGRDRCEILRVRDPLPFVVETLRRLKLLG